MQLLAGTEKARENFDLEPNLLRALSDNKITAVG